MGLAAHPPGRGGPRRRGAPAPPPPVAQQGAPGPEPPGVQAAPPRKAARRGAPIAQNRLARILATGRGAPIDAKEAVKWYIVSKAAGAKDDWLDDYASKQTPEIRAAAQKEAEPWLFLIANSRS